MTRFYEPDLTVDPNGPFVRDASNRLVRRSYWMDMTDQALVMVMTKGIGADLTNDEKRARLIDLKRERRSMRSALKKSCLPKEIDAANDQSQKSRAFGESG